MAEGKWYVLKAAKGAASGSTSIILEGSYDNPKRVMVMGVPTQLTPAEYNTYKDLFEFKEVKEPEPSEEVT